MLDGTGIRGRSDLSAVSVTIGGIRLLALAADPQNESPGMDQVRVELVRSLIGSGSVAVQVEMDREVTNAVTILMR